jgi:hypothetical protein
VSFDYCASADNLSDFLTKALPGGPFRACVVGVGMRECAAA